MLDIQRNALNKLIGTTRSFKGENLTFQKFKEIEDVVTVFTTSRNLNLLPEELEEFLQKLADPVSTVPQTMKDGNTLPAATFQLEGYTPSPENAIIKTTLMDALKRVQGDPTYIPQAKAIIEITEAVVNVQKSEMQMLQLLKGR